MPLTLEIREPQEEEKIVGVRKDGGHQENISHLIN